MAIVWGAYNRTGAVGTNGMRIGVEISWSSVPSSSTTTTTATLDVWTENIFAYSNDDQTIAYSYSPTSPAIVGPGGTAYNNNQGAGVQTKRITKTWTYTYPSNSYGSSPGAFTFTATVGAAFNGVTPTVTINGTNGGTIPARPGGVPTSPSISASATGIRQITATWSASADPAVTRYDVYRNNDPGQLVNSSLATSFADNARGNNESIYYVVYAYNAAGASVAATSNTATTPMLPGQPGSLAADTSTFGTISLTWTVSATTSGYGATYTILRNSTDIGLVTYGSGGPSYSFNDTTVAPYTTYNYVVLPISNVGTGTGATISATSMGGVVNVRSSAGAWIKVVPQVRNSANTAWVTGQARARNNSTSEWKYGT